METESGAEEGLTLAARRFYPLTGQFRTHFEWEDRSDRGSAEKTFGATSAKLLPQGRRDHYQLQEEGKQQQRANRSDRL